MIAAGFLPPCPAAWHQAVHALIESGWWSDIPLAATLPSPIWFAVPAALFAIAALVAASTTNRRALIVLVALSAFAHPWMPLALVPLFLQSSGTARRPLVPAIVGLAGLALAIWLTPGCTTSGEAPGWTALAGAAIRSLGPAALVLVGLDLAAGSRDRRAQFAALLVVMVSGALAATARIDGATAIGLGAAVLWWRAAAGGLRLIEWQTSTASRVGAAALLLLTPLPIAEPLTRSAQQDVEPGTISVWQALDALDEPASVVSTGGRADVATIIWRANGARRRNPITVAELPEEGVVPPEGGALFVWPHRAAPLQARGVVLGRLNSPDDRLSLERVLEADACVRLSVAWTDVSAELTGNQFAGLFPVVAPLRGMLLYLTGDLPLAPHPVDWPADAIAGFDLRNYDRQDAAGAAALAEAAARDGMDLATLGGSRHVVRLRFDRRGTAPAALAVTLSGTAERAGARQYESDETPVERRPSVCRDTRGQVVTAFEGAPERTSLDPDSPQVAGHGWGSHEPDGPGRWTTGPEAQLLFLAYERQPLQLTLEARREPGGPLDPMVRVDLNGVRATCLDGSPPCAWLLPADAFRRGENVLTISVEGGDGTAIPARVLVRDVQLAAVRVAR